MNILIILPSMLQRRVYLSHGTEVIVLDADNFFVVGTITTSYRPRPREAAWLREKDQWCSLHHRRLRPPGGKPDLASFQIMMKYRMIPANAGKSNLDIF